MLRKNEKIITLLRTGDEVEALQMQQRLEDAKIQCSLLGMIGSSMFPRMRTKASELIIQIFQDDLEKAKKVLSEKESQPNNE